MTSATSAERAGLSLSVVIPVYNEQDILAETVAAVVGALRRDEAVSSFEVVVSENGSRDGTRALARELAARYEEVVHLESDVADYGAAMRDGFRAARGDFIVNFDADYYDLEFVARALDVDADIVIAAKGIAGSLDTRLLLRRVVSRGFSLLVRRLLDLRTTETHGMKLFRRAAIEPLLPEIGATKDLFDTELVARAERSGLKVAELPIKTKEMRHSRSGILTRIPRTVLGLVKMRYRLRREYRARPARATQAPEPVSRLARLAADDAVVGRRLLVVGSAGVAVRGAEEALLTLDASGVAVLLVTLSAVTAGTGADIADELDRIAQLTPAEMSGSASGLPAEDAEVADAHRAFFETSSTARPTLNHDQQAVVVLRERPDTNAWEELIVELGGQLAGVYATDGDDLDPLEVPDELRRRAGPRWPVARATLAAAGLVLLGVAIMLTVRARPGETPPAARVAGSAVRDVAAGVPGAATHNQWIGQDHLVRASDGTLLAAYGNQQGLQVVADHANQGRAWQSPVAVSEIRATSSSLAIDDADRLHVAYSDGSRVAYTLVQNSGGRWTSGRILEVDAATTTPYLDVAYDEETDVAHVVWVGEGPGGQAPRWAAISGEGGDPRLLQTGPLAPPATDIPVLVNVAAGPGPLVVATYRRGDSPYGWFARALTPRAGTDFAWGPQERVPIEAGIGAADLAVDRSGVAHLVLRDSTTFQLTYFARNPQGAWSEGETAVDAASIEEIDFPSLTVDRSSRLVYLFFQSDRAQPATGVQVAVRDPARGWEPPFPAAPADAIPDGGFFPASIGETAGAPIVLWTTGGATPVLQAATIAP